MNDLERIKQNGWSIKCVKNPSECVQLTEVKQNVWWIKYIENPSECIQLAAVMQNGWSIKCIKNPSKRVQLAGNYRLNNFFHCISIHSKDKIQIGCTTLSYNEWLEYDSPYCDFVTNKLKQLVLEKLK